MSGRKYLLDTNVIIGFLTGADWALSFVNREATDGAVFYASVITRMELLSFPGISHDEEMKIGHFLNRVRIIGLDYTVEREAVSIRKKTRLKLPDAIISATAFSVGAVLVSADTDFGILKEHEVLNPAQPTPSQ